MNATWDEKQREALALQRRIADLEAQIRSTGRVEMDAETALMLCETWLSWSRGDL